MEPIQRAGCAQGLGRACGGEGYHVDLVLQTLATTLRTKCVVKKAGGWFGGGAAAKKGGLGAGEIDVLRGALLTFWGHVAKYTTPALLESRIDSQIMTNIRSIACDAQSAQLQRSAVETIALVASAVSQEKAGVKEAGLILTHRGDLLAVALGGVDAGIDGLLGGGGGRELLLASLRACNALAESTPALGGAEVGQMLSRAVRVMDIAAGDDDDDESGAQGCAPRESPVGGGQWMTRRCRPGSEYCRLLHALLLTLLRRREGSVSAASRLGGILFGGVDGVEGGAGGGQQGGGEEGEGEGGGGIAHAGLNRWLSGDDILGRRRACDAITVVVSAFPSAEGGARGEGKGEGGADSLPAGALLGLVLPRCVEEDQVVREHALWAVEAIVAVQTSRPVGGYGRFFGQPLVADTTAAAAGDGEEEKQEAAGGGAGGEAPAMPLEAVEWQQTIKRGMLTERVEGFEGLVHAALSLVAPDTVVTVVGVLLQGIKADDPAVSWAAALALRYLVVMQGRNLKRFLPAILGAGTPPGIGSIPDIDFLDTLRVMPGVGGEGPRRAQESMMDAVRALAMHHFHKVRVTRGERRDE